MTLPTAHCPPPTAFNPAQALPIVTDAVARQMGMLAAFRDLDQADMVQKGMMRMLEVHAKYDPNKAAYSTWVNRCVNFMMRDELRARGREWRRQEGVREEARRAVASCQLPVASEEEGAMGLVEWVKCVARAGRRSQPATGHWPLATLAVGALMRRQRLSIRGAHWLLSSRRDLLAAAGLSRVPSLSWLTRAKRAGAQLRGFPAAANNGGRPHGSAGIGKGADLWSMAMGKDWTKFPMHLPQSMILAELLPIGARTLDDMITRKEFPPPDLRLKGGKRFWEREGLRRWFMAQKKPAQKKRKRPSRKPAVVVQTVEGVRA